MSKENTSLLVAGDLTIDLYPVDGTPITRGSRFEWHIGGTATNVARWAASLGSDVDLATNIGTDVLGELAAQYLADSLVGTAHVTRVDAVSPLTLYVVPEADEDWNAWVSESCYGFTLPTDPASIITSYDWVHLEGVTLPAEVNQAAVQRLAAAATENGVRVSFDLNGRENQWDTPSAYRQALRDVLPYCDLIFAGTADLAVADVDPTPSGVLELLSANHSARVFITDGAAETTAIAVENGAIIERVTASPPDVPVVTTAGAGDAFAGAVLAAQQNGISDLKELVTIGNTAGAAAVSTVGPFDIDS